MAGFGRLQVEGLHAHYGAAHILHGVTLLIEHDMDAVFKIADRITVMVNGQVIASDVPERIRTDRAVQLAYLGDAH